MARVLVDVEKGRSARPRCRFQKSDTLLTRETAPTYNQIGIPDTIQGRDGLEGKSSSGQTGRD